MALDANVYAALAGTDWRSMSQKAQWKNRKKNPTRPARDAAVAKANFFFLFSVSRHVSSSKECRVFIRFPTHVSLVLFKIVNGRSRHEHLNVCLLCLCFNSHIKRIKFWFRFCYSKKKKHSRLLSLSPFPMVFERHLDLTTGIYHLYFTFSFM